MNERANKLMYRLAQRGVVEPFYAMDIFKTANALAAAGRDILHLEVGQPATSAPKPVIAAAARALREDRLAYTDALGLGSLREAIAKHYRARANIALAPERVAVTTGSSGGFLLAFLTVFEHGSRVALASPAYPAYRNILTALGIEPVILPVGPAERFQPTRDMLERISGPIHGVLLASPANPTGTMLEPDVLAAIVAFCAERSLWLIVDEIYHGIVYGRHAESVLTLTDRAIVVNSFSKYFSMTGWRLGWLVLPEDLIRPVERLAQNLFISAPTLAQVAALKAFEAYRELDANVARYARNRALLLQELPKAEFDTMAPPDGAFYLYLDIGRFSNDAQDFCRRMLNEIGVATTPGIDFDRECGQRYIRLSFSGATETMAEAARRLRAWKK
jgi:aspartate/methionine/tyrosine aminotransferase